MHAGLFEQFLSFTTPETMQPIKPIPDRNHAQPAQPEENVSDSKSSEAAITVEAEESNQLTADEEAEREAERGAVEDQIAILSATQTVKTAVVAERDEETAAQQIQQTTIVDRQPTTEQGEGEQTRSRETAIAEDVTQAIVDSKGKLETANSTTNEQVLSSLDAPNTTGEVVHKPAHQQVIEDSSNDPQIQQGEEYHQSSELPEPVETASDERAQQNLLGSQGTPSPEDGREQGRHRGEGRSKWYERDSESASLTQANDASPTATDASPEEASIQTSNEQGSDNHSPTEPKPLPTLSKPAAIESTVALVTSTVPIAELVASSFVGSHISSSEASVVGDGAARTSTEGVDVSRPSTKNNSPETKATATDAQRADELTQAERVRLVQRVSRSFTRLGPTGGQVNIRLHPPQLGSLSIQVRIEGRTMTAKLSTESEAARDAIVESLPILRGRLAEQGFEISSFQVEVADNNPDATNNHQQSWSNQADENQNNSSHQFDYRRIAAQHRQPSQVVDRLSSTAESRELSWQAMAGIDLHA